MQQEGFDLVPRLIGRKGASVLTKKNQHDMAAMVLGWMAELVFNKKP